MDVLKVRDDERLADAIAALRDAADVYGWRLAADPAESGVAVVRVLPGACSRQPEVRRVLERARSCHSALIEGIEVGRMPAAGLATA